jgi:hypothetical protein
MPKTTASQIRTISTIVLEGFAKLTDLPELVEAVISGERWDPSGTEDIPQLTLSCPRYTVTATPGIAKPLSPRASASLPHDHPSGKLEVYYTIDIVFHDQQPLLKAA